MLSLVGYHYWWTLFHKYTVTTLTWALSVLGWNLQLSVPKSLWTRSFEEMRNMFLNRNTIWQNCEIWWTKPLRGRFSNHMKQGQIQSGKITLITTVRRLCHCEMIQKMYRNMRLIQKHFNKLFPGVNLRLCKHMELERLTRARHKIWNNLWWSISCTIQGK